MHSHKTQHIPEIFCWTKMGTEAGQGLGAILRRKELERQAGEGTFAWGIGNSLGTSPAFAKRATIDGEVDVLFSPMKSSPKAIDVRPSQLIMWLSYHSREAGLVDLPAHMLITSRGGTASSSEKRSHYALICMRQDEISADHDLGTIDAKRARNLVSLNPLGASQVTAMVKYDRTNTATPEKPYPVAFRARMHSEGFVRLGTPIALTGPLLSAYLALSGASAANDWLARVTDLKQQAQALLASSRRQSKLFIG